MFSMASTSMHSLLFSVQFDPPLILKSNVSPFVFFKFYSGLEIVIIGISLSYSTMFSFSSPTSSTWNETFSSFYSFYGLDPLSLSFPLSCFTISTSTSILANSFGSSTLIL